MQFLCPIVKQLKTLNFVDRGRVKRIRGIAYVWYLPICSQWDSPSSDMLFA